MKKFKSYKYFEFKIFKSYIILKFYKSLIMYKIIFAKYF